MPFSLQAALLGVVQGLTEFLPVSSSAHLILARAFFGFDADRFGLGFDVACHVGTLMAVLVYFRRDVARMIAALPRALDLRFAWNVVTRPAGLTARGDERETEDGVRLLWFLSIGTIPAVVVGLLFNDVIEQQLRTPGVTGLTLAAGALLLLVADRRGAKVRSDESLSLSEAFWLGCAQAVALVPGVSRSGATLTLALLLGLRRPEAARFIFLLGIPAILAAAAKEGVAAAGAGWTPDAAVLVAIGVATSAIVGYVAIKYFIRYLGKHSLDLFAWYRMALATTVAVWKWH
jgi:undecaprenyl-diphosphatase